MTKKSWKKYLPISIFTGVFLVAIPAICSAATAGSGGITGLAEGLRQQIVSVADVLIIVSYVAGVGFALAGIVQFKAHKDNPTQVPLSKPLIYMVVGGALLFLPNILETAGSTIFGKDKEEALKKEFKLK